MEIPNRFLITLVRHENIVENCFCDDCRPRRLMALRNFDQNRVYDHFTRYLPLLENAKLDNYHSHVLRQIVFGEHFKRTSLERSGLRYFRCWAKNEYPHLKGKELKTFCDNVNEASWVYNNWNKIVENLTDRRMKFDARRFSVHMFYESKSLAWCLSYNDEQLRKKGKMSKDQPLYPIDKVNNCHLFTT